MTGLFPPTSGTGIVGPYSINNDMENIYSEMGICPQHNILWGELTAESHQYFFGRLKGQKGNALRAEVKKNLEAVNLAMPNLKNRGAAGFSGGMQRRLSVANSIIGNPSVVYMDEPSTGLDPASRRQLWDVISKAKRDKSVILTTHSMEEADVLCDQLGIMSGGRLLCLGPAYDLKRRFGKGYTCIVSTKEKKSFKS
jgi:ABC-type multidrug transport system ATPase subunit